MKPRVVDEVQNRKDRPESLAEIGLFGHPIRDAGGLDLVLGSNEPLRHRRLAQQERAGHLVHAQAAEQPKGQGDLVLRAERRVAAGEDQSEPIVPHGSVPPSVRSVRCACKHAKLFMELPAPS